MTHDLIVEDGTLVTANETYDGDLIVEDGKIAGIITSANDVEATSRVDASGKVVLPGVVDPHVHFNDPNNIDDFKHGSRAAALGGVTTIITFAWQAWVGEQSPWSEPGPLHEGVERQLSAGSESVVDYALHGTLSREDDAVLDELEGFVADGIVSFKLFTAYEFGLSNGFIQRVLDRLADLGAVAVVHTEDDSICTTREVQMRADGRGRPEEYPDSRPPHAEAMAADDLLRMVKETGVKYYGFHTSCRSSAEVIDSHRTDGSQIRAETCTHYTTLDESIYAQKGTLPVIAPPIRTSEDKDAMFDYLDRGVLDVVSTDHVGFKRADKQTEKWWDAPYGANSVQRSLPVFHDEAIVKRGYSYPFLVRVMCTNPARTFGFDQKGTLTPGTDADFVIFDPDVTQTIDAKDNASKADYSMYEGREVTGAVEQTYIRGQLIADNGKVKVESGYGDFIRRSQPDWSE
jgi:dihydropyrimidinase